jgi:hypothetical protein
MNTNQEPGQTVYVKRLVDPRRKQVNILIKAFRWGAINSNLFEALVGIPPQELETEEGEKVIFKNAKKKAFKVAVARDYVKTFVEKAVSFEPGGVPIEMVYQAYLEYYNFDNEAIERLEAMSRCAFTQWFLNNYSDHAREKVVRYKGKPTRCFIGVRLLSMDELVVE